MSRVYSTCGARPCASLCRAHRSSMAKSRASLYVAVRRPESMTSSSRSANPAFTGCWPGEL